MISDINKIKMEKYILNVLKEAEKDFDNLKLTPYDYEAFLYLCMIAIQIGYRKDKWDQIGYRICYEIKQNIENYHYYKQNIGMLSGFGYTCFAVECYSKSSGRLKNFSKSLHKLLLEELKRMAISQQYGYSNVRSGDFDSISGISGVLYYLMDYTLCEDKELYTNAVACATDYLIGLTGMKEYKNQEIFNFHICSENQFLSMEKKQYPDGNINFGMAHGMIGPLTALARAYGMGVQRKGMEPAIELLFNLYKEFEVCEEGGSYWPGQLSYDEYQQSYVKPESIHYASSWCYGNAGILGGMITAAHSLKNSVLETELKNKLHVALNKRTKELYLISPSLCHGFAGVLAHKMLLIDPTMERKHKNNEVDNFIERIINLSERNTHEAIKYPDKIVTEDGRLEGYIGEYSLLNGVVGISAVFAEILYGIVDYRKLMLIG